MSNQVDLAKKDLEKFAEINKLQQDNLEKRVILDNKTLNSRLQKQTEAEQNIEASKGANFDELTPAQIKKLQNDNEEYMEAAKNAITFIDPMFLNIVPFFRKNFILIGAKTGEGKSTVVANIVYQNLLSVNPVNNKRRKTLVITNEERAEDFYNRVTALFKGWAYTNHNKFTDEQMKEFSRNIPLLAKDGNLTVIDDNHCGISGTTTTLEGICGIFDNLIEKGIHYDAVLIDYYQNIAESTLNPKMSEWDVQAALSRKMDYYKNLYPAPIVMMCQVNAPTEKDNKPFKERIAGRKKIMDPATFAGEIVADRKKYTTTWIVHKSRYVETMGNDLVTGYNRGRFVKYDESFIVQIQNYKMKLNDKQNGQELKDKIGENNGNNT